MKNSVLLTLFVLLIFGGNLNAQQKDLQSKKVKSEMIDKMKDKLSLSDQQISQIQAIDAKYKTQEKDLKARMQKVKDEYRAVRKQKKSEIDQVFTEEQRNKISEWKSKSKKGKKFNIKKGSKADSKIQRP